jgi:signal transduction histidine kinase/CheY-like chemotaxis protein
MRSGETHLLETIEPDFLEAFAQDDRHREIIRALGLRSWIIVPILAGGRTYGTLTLVHAESGRRYSKRDLPFVEDLATRVGVAVHNAVLYVAAQAANRAKDEFLATLSHELRTPMTAIVGWARMLEMSDLPPSMLREGIQAISRGARAQAQLIDDLLDVSRITVGKLHLDLRDVAVDEVVLGAVDAVRATANVKGIALDLHFDPKRPQVVGDPNRLQQVVWNLVSNAVKFTPPGGRVDVFVGRDDGKAFVSVTDSGEGIRSDFLPYVFDRFRQADSTTTRRFGGLGLGLAIVKQITELHGGTVSASSPGLGLGATFTVILPLAPTFMASLGPEPMREPVAAAVALPRLDGKDVLVVDDDVNARRFITAVLESAGATVRNVESADAALSLLRSSVPSVLVSDIAMPVRDGFALLDGVRNELGIDGTTLPVIAITAFGGPEDRARILTAGFAGYILKPVEPLQLAQQIADVLAGE